MAGTLLSENKVVVGVDFGTTFSGIAWAKVGDDHPNLIQQWPGDSAPSSEKFPTQILYDDSSTGLRWGYQIPSMAERYQSFKLDQEAMNSVKSSLISQCYSDPKAHSPNEAHTAEKLTTDYLKALKEHLHFIIGRELGNFRAHKTPLQFLITVPAIWSDIAKEKTLNAAEKAGFGDDAPIHMISEPEAAAVYVLQRRKLHNLFVGDTFVVCDAGGGTVDLISYTVTSLDLVLEVKEAASGSGGRCGSTFINGRFKDYLKFRLQHEAGWDDEVLQDAMNDFEIQVKRSYSSKSSDETYTVRVPGLNQNSDIGINRRGKLVLKAGDVKEILEPVVAEVVQLVLDQIRATQKEVKCIILVGGFGANKYLHERLREAVKDTIEIIKPPYAWSAVVQGALIRILSHHDPEYSTVRLSTRVARKHIGVNVCEIFNKSRHDINKRHFDPFDGEYTVTCMNWFIKKGGSVSEEIPLKFDYQRKWLMSEGQRKSFSSTIYCDRTDHPPVLYKDHNVEELVLLMADTSSVPSELLRTKQGKDGKLYYLFSYSIEVVYHSAQTEYNLISNGKRYGSVTAEYA